MLKITRVNHSAIATKSSVEEMKRFYVDVLGVSTVKREIPAEVEDVIPGFWMQFPNGQVHVIGNRAPESEIGPMGNGSANPIGPHIAYFVEDLDAAERHLADQKLTFHRMGG